MATTTAAGRQWSTYQTAVFTFVKKAQGHTLVNAVAGSGKTTTIVEAAKFVPVRDRSVFLAFNKHIAEELGKKLPGHVKAMTCHALGFRALNAAGNGARAKLETDKVRNIMRDLLSAPERIQIGGQIKKLVSVAKAAGIVPAKSAGYATGLVPDEQETWDELIEHYQVELEDGWQEETAIARARDILKLSLDQCDKVIDFDDMLYVPIVLNLPFPRFNWIFVDEAQDLSGIQHEMVKRSLAQGGHVIAVGDPHQAIYGFRGAQSDSMGQMAEELGAGELPLSICYRCAKSVVMEAKQLVPHIEHAESAPDGVVRFGLPDQNALADLAPDSAVLCPFNAPLIACAFALIRNRVACRVLGREIGQGLAKLLKKLNALTVQEAEEKLEQYYQDELRRLGDKENRIAILEDKIATLRIFLEEAPSGESVDVIIGQIERMFTDTPGGMLTLSTIHKAKGLEWNKVFLLDSHLLHGTRIGKRELMPWEVEQRRNLLYVGITRAMRELVYLDSKVDLDKLR